jgi:hypothetical protein
MIFEDFGPAFSIALVPQAFILVYAWPLAIGTVSLYYCGENPCFLSPFGSLAHWLQP